MIRIDVDGPEPLEEQVASQLRRAVAQGDVAAGDELPSVRQLSADLGVHWNTVARAYRRLGDEGLLVVRRGRSVRVAPPRAPQQRVTRAGLRTQLASTIATGVLGGLSREDITKAFQEALAGFGEWKQR